MEIELPDGTILDAPEGSDPSAVAKNYLRNQRRAAYANDPMAQTDPSHPGYQYDPTSAMSGLQKFMAGAGKGVVDIGRGIKQLSVEATGLDGSRLRKEQDERQAMDDPLMSSGSGLAGNIAGQVATFMLPASMGAKAASALGAPGVAGALGGFANPTTYGAAAASGGLMGAVQPVGEDQSRTMNTAIGAGTGLLAQGAARGLGRLLKPSQSQSSPAYQKAVERLKDADIPIDAAQKTGSSKLGMLKRMLNDNPLTASGQESQFERVAKAFDRAALKTIGETADVADEKVLSRAASRIGGVMDDVAARNPVKIDDKMLTSLSDIAEKAGQELEGPQARQILAQVDEIMKKADNGTVSGPAYKSIREALGRLQGGSSSGVKHWAGQLKGVLDDALERSADSADVAALRTARTQWRNLEGISKVIGSQEGQHISPAKLANALNTRGYGGKVAMTRGKGATDLMKLAKAGSTVLTDRFPQSGTAPRAAMQLLLPGAVGAGYGYAKEGDLGGAAAYGVGGMALPLLLQRGLNPATSESMLSRLGAGYLGNGLKGSFPRAAENELIKKLIESGVLLAPAAKAAPIPYMLNEAN